MQDTHTIVVFSTLVAFAVGSMPATMQADASIESPAAATTMAAHRITDEDARGISDLIRQIVLNNVPLEYEDTKKWGGTKEVWAGLKISRDGLRLKTKRRKKEVNHGTWKRYRAWMIDPERQFSIGLENVQGVPNTGIGFDLIVDSRLGATARWSDWQTGIQLYSISADAEARVRLRMRCQLGLSLGTAHFPPDVILEPTVTRATLELKDFRIHRISKLDGPVVKQLGRALRDMLQDELNRRQDKIMVEINDEIHEHRDALTFSLHDLAERGVHRLWQRFGDVGSAAASSETVPTSLVR